MARFIAYVVAGVPAAIGVAFVARYAYITSDTPIDGASNAFLFGMIAVGAFAGPAVVIALSNVGRGGAAWLFGFLTALAIATNWTHTLGAIAQRGAGHEALSSKAKTDDADARKELLRLEARIDALGKFTPATAETVSAATAAVASAERARSAECGNGDPKQRGANCRARETAEQDKRDALATAIANKTTTDTASKLEANAAAVRAKLAKAGPAPTTNSLGETLSNILPWVPAAAAASLQQGLVSFIVEMLIAAILALPELLRPRAHSIDKPAPTTHATPEASSEPVEAREPVGIVTPTAPPSLASVARFLLACTKRAKGEKVTWEALYVRYRAWCSEQNPPLAPVDVKTFGNRLDAMRSEVGLRTRIQGEDVFCIDLKLVA